MTLVESTPEALESTVPELSDKAAALLPAARRLVWRDRKIHSGRQLAKMLHTRYETAAEIRPVLLDEYPNLPVSAPAPGGDALTEATGGWPALPGPFPASMTPHHPSEAPTRSRRTQTVALVIPLLLVNSAAVYGQGGWFHQYVIGQWPIAYGFAAAVESIAVYLAVEAHAALMAGDASARLRLGSYLMGVLVGALNYAHFAGPGYAPNPVALTFGVLSSISPWLWSIRSRSMNRDRLRELGQVDPRAVRFSVLRWALFPIRTGRAFRYAVWAGIVQPAEAVAIADQRRK